MTEPKKRGRGEVPASSDELDVAQREVVDLLRNNKYLLRLLIGVVVVSLAIISVTGIVANRSATNAENVGEQNNRFLDNFSNYMRCLIVNEDDVVVAVGEDAYVAICEELLYRDTGKKPNPIIATIPPEFQTTTTTGG